MSKTITGAVLGALALLACAPVAARAAEVRFSTGVNYTSGGYGQAKATDVYLVPLTAKLRAGIDSPAHLCGLVTACAEAGAAAVTLHARLRIHGYDEPATWAWLAEATAALRRCPRPVPLIGNGGIDAPGDIAAMRAATGVAAVMVGRAALADPFIFRVAAGGAAATASEAAAWAVAYLDALGGGGPKAKQLARWYRAGGLLADRAERWRLLRGPAEAIRPWFAAQAVGSSIQNVVVPAADS
jgi:tRNA-dihydrouridine synthase